MRISAGHVAYGSAFLLFAVLIAIGLLRDKFPRDRRRCTATCDGSIVRVDHVTGLPVIRMFPPGSAGMEFIHVRPVWAPDGGIPAYGTKVSVRYDPDQPWTGPHVLEQEIRPHARSVAKLAVLAFALAVAGSVLLGRGLVPPA